MEIKDLVGLSEPLSKIVDAARACAAQLYEPHAIRYRAKAQADAAIIKAEAQLRIEEMTQRAKERNEKKEIRRQRNIEAIAAHAVEYAGGVLVLPPPEDWANQFFDDCKDVSDEMMREIWARILAGEIAQPGRFSRRTLRVVRDIFPADAEAFQIAASYIWWGGDHNNPAYPTLIVPHVNDALIKFESIQELDSCGLIKSEPFGYRSSPVLAELPIRYFGERYTLRRTDPVTLPLGQVILTRAGQELVQVVTGAANETARQAAIDYWAAQGWRIEPAA